MQAQRGGGVVVPDIRNMGSRSGWEISTKPGPFYPREKPGTPSTRAVWVSGPVWTCTENLTPPRLDLRTYQPVASRFIDHAAPLYLVQ
jgi:hypothetical protein